MSKGKKFNAWLPNFGAKGWGITIICLFFFIFNMYWNSVTNVLFGYFSEAYGWVETDMSFVITISGWISLVAIAIFGGLVRKIGAKLICTVGLIGSAVGFVLLANMNGNFGMYFAGVLVFYVFMVAYATVGVGSIGSAWFPRTRGAFMGIATIGMTLSSAALNPIILGFMGSPLGVSGWFWACAIVLAILAIVVAVFFKNNPEEAGAYPDNDRSITREQLDAEFAVLQEYKKNSPWTLGKILATPQTWCIALATGLPLLAGNGLLALLVPTLAAFGQDPLFGVVLLSSMWPVGLLGHYLIGVMDVKLGTKPTTVCVCIIAGCAGVLIFFLGGNTIACAISTALFLFGLSGSANMCMSLSSMVYGRADFEVAYPTIQVIFNILSFAGVSVMAIVASSFGYTMIPLAMAVLCFAALIPTLLIPAKQIGSQMQSQPEAGTVE
ncbi:MAG TPA: MFS transporter [Candidatus Aphodovivens avistercoris]|nr:MFS transporter [Candidatus Aphodovivens avistercoris]